MSVGRELMGKEEEKEDDDDDETPPASFDSAPRDRLEEGGEERVVG